MEASAENKIHIQLWGKLKIFSTRKYIIGENYFPARISLPFRFLMTYICCLYARFIYLYIAQNSLLTDFLHVPTGLHHTSLPT